jgi:hypothetical protein
MKHLLLFFALSLFLSSNGQDTKITASTKDHKRTITWIGFKGGFNRSHIVGRELDGDKTGYVGGELYGGFFAETMLSKRINIETELLFSWTDDYHFIELPVHLELTFGPKWSIFAGPKLDYIVDNDKNALESEYKFKKFGVSADLGVQYNITRIFFAEIRHSRGFTEQVTNTFLEIYNGKRNTSRIGLGICF